MAKATKSKAKKTSKGSAKKVKAMAKTKAVKGRTAKTSGKVAPKAKTPKKSVKKSTKKAASAKAKVAKKSKPTKAAVKGKAKATTPAKRSIFTEKQPFFDLLSRSNGSNVVQTAAYCRGTKLSDHKTGYVYDYTSKKNVIQSEIVIPKHSPQWLKNITELQKVDPNKASEILWNSVESNEKNKDGLLACKLRAIFPDKLTEHQNRSLCYEYLDFFIQKGMVADVNIHWEKENPYILIILSLMEIAEDGWGRVEKEWSTQQFKNQVQEKWEETCNQYK